MSPSAPSAIKAVVFDLDGLMFNTELVFHLSGQELLRRRGKEWTPVIQHGMMGRRAEEAFQVLIDQAGLSESVEELRNESRDIFYEFLPVHLAPMPGLFELLQAIDERRLLKGVATSSSRRYLDDLLGRFDLGARFQMTLTADDVTRGKPNPEIYLKAAARLNVAPGEMLVLEDSEAGTRAGVAAGAVVVSVPHEYSRQHDFSGAAHIAQGLHDSRILQILGDLSG